ncbi:MAG: lysophospholipid acyltransferase family protein [Dysgonamonadaceae bacterium]|jgi:KDO2-lipid IV(A) lauroyltransferase|nr:lysophospholipid acyltransferase family protein [Dysgonamonadaceae bacterium]
MSFWYGIINVAWFLSSLLPLRALYIVSDILYFPLYYFIRYRRKVVRKNLLNSFPDKSLKEIIRIEKGFYSFFCDYVVETLKLYSMSRKEMTKRMSFGGVEAVERLMGSDKSCILCLGHYGNWEWISSLALHIDKNIYPGQIYRPLRNKLSDKLFLKIRGRFGTNSIPQEQTLRKIVHLRNGKRQFMIGFIADQVPIWTSIRYWTDFLHQDTPVFSGPERIARQTGAIAVYVDVTRIKRGYYHCELVPLSSNPQELPEHALTDQYFHCLENTILREPRFWLWSHNRWKRQRKLSDE